MSLAEACYHVTRNFPREEQFGLTSQIRRSAASIPANIAEGHGREHTGSFIQPLRIARGSLKELKTHVSLAERVGILGSGDSQTMFAQCESLGKRIRALLRSLQQKA